MRLKGYPTDGAPALSYVGTPTGSMIGTADRPVGKVISLPGFPGPRGAQGDPGPAGSKGDKGDQGPKGDKGDKGDTGDRGPKGDGLQIDFIVSSYSNLPGDLTAGDAGYAVYVQDEGRLYIWSGTSWPTQGTGAEIKGEQGDPGPKGDKGDPGDPGPEGDPGKVQAVFVDDPVSYNASPGQIVVCKTTNNQTQVNLPSAPPDGTVIEACLATGSVLRILVSAQGTDVVEPQNYTGWYIASIGSAWLFAYNASEQRWYVSQAGAVGPKGDKGDTGAKGDKGDQGDPGEGGSSFEYVSSLPPTGTAEVVYVRSGEDKYEAFLWDGLFYLKIWETSPRPKVLSVGPVTTGFTEDSSSTQFQHTAPAGSYVVAVTTGARSYQPGSITYGGTSMTKLNSSSDRAGVQFWGLPDAPAGSQSVIATGTTRATLVAMLYVDGATSAEYKAGPKGSGSLSQSVSCSLNQIIIQAFAFNDEPTPSVQANFPGVTGGVQDVTFFNGLSEYAGMSVSHATASTTFTLPSWSGVDEKTAGAIVLKNDNEYH